ncbi:uncharacterized protein FYW47_005254 [Aplochiton taeniatus]
MVTKQCAGSPIGLPDDFIVEDLLAFHSIHLPSTFCFLQDILFPFSANDSLYFLFFSISLAARILPPTSNTFLLKNLVSGADYSLCVLAIFDDGLSSLATTKVLGCTQFSTKEDFPECRSLQAHFLGGTLTVMVGGVIVVTLLVFTVAMMVRHRVCGDCHDDGDYPAHPHDDFMHAKGGVDVYAQTNGNGTGSVMMVALPKGMLSQPAKPLPSKAKAQSRSRTMEKVKASPELHSKDGKGLEVAVREKKFPPFTPESERVTLYYSPANTSQTLPHLRAHKALKHSSRFKLHHSDERDRDIDKMFGSKNSLTSEGEGKAGAGRVKNWKAGERPPFGPTRSCSFDVGEITTTTTTCYGYAKRLSVIWTRRSQSLHSMLVQCASTAGSVSSAGSDRPSGTLARGYLHAYNTSNSNSNSSVFANAGDLDESVV